MNDLAGTPAVNELDADRCYEAAKSRDARFDGRFITAVKTTGIYCRPSCPAITPKRNNVEFFRTAAGAQLHGFRACKRCRPDAAPGSPEWDWRGDLVARAMRLIGDGVIDREGVSGLAGRLGYSDRQLHRVLTAELGAGPLAIARAQRAQTARTLIETTDLPMADIAFAAGFGSIRQFNDTVREVFAAAPTELRSKQTTERDDVGAVAVRLPYREPFAGEQLFAFLAHRAVAGVEYVDGGTYSRALGLPHGHGTVDARLGDGYVAATFRLTDWRDLAPAVGRVRRLLDLDADPVAIDDAFLMDPVLGPMVRTTPGLRAAGSVDAAETVIRAITGQQVSVAGARTVTARMATSLGERLNIAHEHLTHLFPSMASIATASPDVFPMPKARAATLQRVAAAVATGSVDLDQDRGDVAEQLLALRGIGPWTADYVVMRGLGDPDMFLSTDLGVKQALEAVGLDAAASERWRPWRTYAQHHLWNSLDTNRIGA